MKDRVIRRAFTPSGPLWSLWGSWGQREVHGLWDQKRWWSDVCADGLWGPGNWGSIESSFWIHTREIMTNPHGYSEFSELICNVPVSLCLVYKNASYQICVLPPLSAAQLNLWSIPRLILPIASALCLTSADNRVGHTPPVLPFWKILVCPSGLRSQSPCYDIHSMPHAVPLSCVLLSGWHFYFLLP